MVKASSSTVCVCAIATFAALSCIGLIVRVSSLNAARARALAEPPWYEPFADGGGGGRGRWVTIAQPNGASSHTRTHTRSGAVRGLLDDLPEGEKGTSWLLHTPKQKSPQGWNADAEKRPAVAHSAGRSRVETVAHTLLHMRGDTHTQTRTGADALAKKVVQVASAQAAARIQRIAALDPFFGSTADLAHHQENGVCWEHFDFGMLSDWDARARVFCKPDEMNIDASASAAAGTDVRTQLEAMVPVDSTAVPERSWLVCRVTTDQHLPPATAPHTMCDGANIVVDFSRLSQAQCPAFRQGYKCDGAAVFYHYSTGALRARCTKTDHFRQDAFPRDHLMDIFTSFQGDSGTSLPSPAAAPVTLFVTRERAEHANPFHATTDFINAFFTLHVAGIINGQTGGRSGMEDVQVVLLDEQSGPFDEHMWRTVFSPVHGVSRPSTLRASGPMTFRRALFVPPGYTNMLLAHVLTEGECHAATQAFQAYRHFVLSAHGLEAPPLPEENSDQVIVTFVSRRPYNKFVDHAFMGRQVDNEEELLGAMRGVSGVVVSRVDFALMDVPAQLSVMAQTEILVGMHGAAMTYAIYMPGYGGVLEMWPKNHDMWRCFEHISAMSGLYYQRWENGNPSHFRTDNAGDYTRIDINQFLPMFQDVVANVLARRNQQGEAAKADAARLEAEGDVRSHVGDAG